MNENRKKTVLDWMYVKLSHKWFTPYVLDPIHNKAGNPPCSLSITEIYSVFETLRKEEFIFPVINQYGYPCFVLNEMKELDWIKRIEDTAPTKGQIVGGFVKKESAFAFREAFSGVIGGIVGYVIARMFGT